MHTLGILAPEAIAIEEEVSPEPHEGLILLVTHIIWSHKVGKPLLDKGKLVIGIQVSLLPRDVAVSKLMLTIAIASGERWDRRVVRKNGDNGRRMGSQGDGAIDHVREGVELVDPVFKLAIVLLDWRIARLLQVPG